MRNTNNGKWMLGFLVAAALLVPGVVAARQSSSSVAPRAAAQSVVVPAALTPGPGMCFNNPCVNHNECRTWCEDPGAVCRALPGTIGKRCVLR